MLKNIAVKITRTEYKDINIASSNSSFNISKVFAIFYHLSCIILF